MTLSKMPQMSASKLLRLLRKQGFVTKRTAAGWLTFHPERPRAVVSFHESNVEGRGSRSWNNMTRDLMRIGLLPPQDWEDKRHAERRQRVADISARHDQRMALAEAKAAASASPVPELGREVVMTEAAAAPAAQEPEPLPYKCDQCDRTFARPLNLGRHKQAIHGVTGTAPSSVATREKNAAKRKRPAAASPPAPVEAKMAPSGKPSAGPVRVRQQEPATTAGQVRLLLNEMRMVNAERDQHLVDLISELERENSLLRKERDEVKAKLAKVSHQLDELAIAFK